VKIHDNLGILQSRVNNKFSHCDESLGFIQLCGSVEAVGYHEELSAGFKDCMEEGGSACGVVWCGLIFCAAIYQSLIIFENLIVLLLPFLHMFEIAGDFYVVLTCQLFFDNFFNLFS